MPDSRTKPGGRDRVKIIDATLYEDDRGYFFESYNLKMFEELGVGYEFVQDNHSGSKQGVLRGLHYQINHAQGKLVRVLVGEIYDVAVDLRKGSPEFGQPVSLQLESKDRKSIWIPPGFAHGFYTLSEWAEVLYKTTDYYFPEHERTLLWNDPELGIDWPLIDGQAPLVSEKDARGKRLSEADTFP